MFKLILASLLSFSFSVSLAQKPIQAYVTQHQVQLRSVDPTQSDYSDLSIIGEAIGDARIVMLGEQDHGDAPAFLAKTRIIQYLHEKKGFNVLAFESDFFGLNYNWQMVENGGMTLQDYINKNISPIWSMCTACSHLFKTYLPTCLGTGNVIEVSGFDCQMNTKYLMPILDSVLRLYKLPITSSPEYGSALLPLLSTWYNYTKDTATTDKIISIYTEIKKQLAARQDIDEFWMQTVDNLIQQNIQFRNWKQDYWKDMNTRDRQMAANLRWLALKKYPNDKIIVWAHNYHVSKYAGHFPEDFLNNANSMGTVFTEETLLLNQTYILGFSSLKGTAGRLSQKTYKIQKPGPNSFEHWINPNFEYAFVDFKKYNLANPSGKDLFFMAGSIKGNNHHTNHEAEWNKIFDGVIFIRNMYPCEPVAH